MIVLGRKVSATGRCRGCDRAVVYLKHPHRSAHLRPHLVVAGMFLAMKDGAPVPHGTAECLEDQL